MACVSSALIVGGGIAGMAAAIALEQVGVHCDVAEIGDLGPVGAGIGLAGRAPNALDELGVYEQVAATGQPGLGAPTTYDEAGRVVAAPPPPQPISGALPPIGAYRPLLAEALLERARAVGATIETGTSITSITETTEGAAVVMTTGEQRTYDVVIGADGVNSRVRALVFPDAPEPEYTGQMSIRWTFPSGPIPGEGWYVAGKLGKLAFYHQPYPRVMYVPMVLNMPEKRLSQQETYEIVDDLLGRFSAEPIVELRSHLRPDSAFIPRPFTSLLLERPWHRGRTLVIGDAAHATTAHMGMGGGMALEDAAVLGQVFAAAPSLEDALRTFEERRFARTSTVVTTSVALSRREQEDLPPGPETAALMHAAMGVLTAPY